MTQSKTRVKIKIEINVHSPKVRDKALWIHNISDRLSVKVERKMDNTPKELSQSSLVTSWLSDWKQNYWEKSQEIENLVKEIVTGKLQTYKNNWTFKHEGHLET